MSSNIAPTYRIAARWEPYDAVVLAWPDNKSTDEMWEFYEALASVLPDYADVIIFSGIGQGADIKEHIESFGISTESIYIYEIDYQDIHVGNWGPLIVESSAGFLFFKQENNNSHFIQFAEKLFPYANMQSLSFTIEHGMMETDGANQIIINKQLCIQKNPQIAFSDIIDFLRNSCGIIDFIALNPPQLLNYVPLRLCPGNRLLKTTCNDKASIYYQDFLRLEKDLEEILKSVETEFDVIDLPWVGSLTDENEEVYFADYSQFFILNEAVLLPLFNLPTDEDAMEILSKVFPGFDILGFPSAALARVNTSLLQISLSIPEGVLEPLYE